MRASNIIYLVPYLLISVAVSACNSLYWPTSPDANWTIHETSRFSLYVRPGSFCATVAQELGEGLEYQYDHATAALALAQSGPITLFLYNSGAEVTPSLGAGRSGVAFPQTGAVHAVCFAPLDDNLRGLLAHEANHVIVKRALGTPGTSFMNEGLASALVSERVFGPTALHAWARTRRAQLPSIATLADDAQWSSSSELGYKTSASFLAWLLETQGRERLRQVYHASSKEIGDRVRAVYGVTLEQLEAQWLAFLGGATTAAGPALAGAR